MLNIENIEIWVREFVNEKTVLVKIILKHAYGRRTQAGLEKNILHFIFYVSIRYTF